MSSASFSILSISGGTITENSKIHTPDLYELIALPGPTAYLLPGGCRWRAVLLLPVLRFWGQFLLFMGFFMIPKVKGWHNLKEAHRLRCILVFNHVSYLDALIVGSLFSPAGLAKVPPPPPPPNNSYIFVSAPSVTDLDLSDAYSL